MTLYRDSIDLLLIEWGKAAREDTLKLQYQPQLLGRIKGSTVKSATISPEDYELVDQAISTLKLQNDGLHDIACMIYILDWTYSVIQRETKQAKSTISGKRGAIIDHVANYLNNVGG